MWSLLLLFWVQPLFSLPKTADSIAQSYSNIKETGENAGFNDKEFERKMKDKPIYWKKSLQWCAFFLSLCLEESDAIFPTIRSGSSQRFITKQSIPFKDVLYGKKKLDKPLEEVIKEMIEMFPMCNEIRNYKNQIAWKRDDTNAN